ncbi:MAG: hypothetical protein ACM3NR_00970 [Methanosarcina sp.]
MKRGKIYELFRRIPAWVLSLLAALSAAVVTGIINNHFHEPVTYIVWSLLLIIASFLICIIHPEKVWSVPLLCNILVILPAACDDSFWTTHFGIIIGTGIFFSFVMAHLGAMIGVKIGGNRQNTDQTI